MAGPLRVLELIVSTGLGGGPAQVRELVRHLAPAELAVTVAGPSGGPYARIFGDGGTPFVEIATDRLGIGPLAAVLGLAPRGRTHVIVNGIDVRRIALAATPRPAARKALGLEPDALVVGTVARFDPVKALDVLLRGFAVLAAIQPTARLVLIGDGPEARRLRALARSLGIDAQVRFAGVVADASRLLPALDLYASASRREGLPLALLEAMACGLPVAATRVSGHVDVVEDGVTGVLVPPDDPAALGRAMDALVVNPARREVMGQAGRRRAEERFAASRMAAETADLYRVAARRFAGGRASAPGV